MTFLKTRAILLYPLVFAVFPPVFLYADNPNEGIRFSEFIVPTAVIVVAAAFLVLVFRLIIRDSVKASAIASIFILIFFAYGPIHDYLWIHRVSIGGLFIGRHTYLLPISTAIALTSVPLVLLYRRSLAPLMQVAVAGVAILVIFNVGRIAVDGVGQDGGTIDNQVIASASGAVSNGVELPDIYYIILDGYGRADVLQETHNFDNSEFIEFLTGKGFFVAAESRSNYVQTSFSLPSSLNMRYLQLGDPHWRLVYDSAVLHYVQNLGYKYVHLDSGWGITRRNKLADVEILGDNPLQLLLNDYSAVLLRSTMIGPVADRLGINLDSPFTAKVAKRFRENMQSLREIPAILGPTFTFNHNVPPHPPYIFDRDGNRPSGSRFEFQGNIWKATDLYIDQMRYVNNTIEQVVNDILASSSAEPIIIIQGDHGPGSQLRDGSTGSNYFDNPSDLAIFEATGILNAYYLPEYCSSGLYPGISPVNSFRVVFNSCFGADFDLLPDETYWIEGTSGEPIDFAAIGQ